MAELKEVWEAGEKVSAPNLDSDQVLVTRCFPFQGALGPSKQCPCPGSYAVADPLSAWTVMCK